MEEAEFGELRKELYKEIDALKRTSLSFKSRVSVIANLIMPGLGFFVYGQAYLQGVISMGLYILYNILFFYKILPNTDVALVYYVPAVVIWVVSTVMVSGLDD